MENEQDDIEIEDSDDEIEPYFVHGFRAAIEKGIKVNARMIVDSLHLVKNDGVVPVNNYRSFISTLFIGRVPNCFIEGIVKGIHLQKTIVETQGQIILFLEKRSFGVDQIEFNHYEILMMENLFSVLGSAVSTDTDYYDEFCQDIYTIYRQDIPWTVYQIFFIIDRVPPKEFCDLLKHKNHQLKLQLKKKYLNTNASSTMDLLENDIIMESPFDLLKKQNLEINSNHGSLLLKGPLQDRLDQIDMKCTEKEKLQREKTKKRQNYPPLPYYPPHHTATTILISPITREE